MQQVSVLETNIGSSTTGNSADTQIIFNDAGTLRGDTGLVYNKATDLLSFGAGLCYGLLTSASATITGDLTVDTSTLKVDSANNRVGIGTATPQQTLDVSGTINSIQARFGNVNGRGLTIGTALVSGVNEAGSVFNALGSGSGAHIFQVDSVDQMRLNSTGLGVGVTPQTGFKITTNGNIGFWSASRADFNNQDNTAAYGVQCVGTVGAATLNFVQLGVATRMVLDNSGNVGVGVTPSAGKGCLQLSSGINFPATQVASSDANTLDDYEEGSWTPTVIGTTTNGVGTYTNQVGFYTKVGNLVTVQAYITWTAHTATGNMRLSGLPFANSPTAGSFSSVCFGYVNNLALTAGNILTGFTSVGNTFIDCFQTPTGGGASTSVPIDTAAELIYTVTYRV